MPSTAIGAAIGLGLGAYGEKPKVPDLTPVDTNAVQQQTIAGNQASFADIAKLAASVNTFNQDQLNALIDRVLPGARQQIQQTLASQLRGEIPQDVRNAIYRSNAERGVSTNAFGGQFKENINARDIGLTSLQITNNALSSAESWLQRAAAPTFDVTSMFFTPQQRLAQENLQQERQFNRDLLAAGVKAAPDPGMAALAQGIDQDTARVENAALSFAGASVGGGLGSGGASPAAGVSAYNQGSANRMAGGLAGGIGGLGY